jgi:arylsulfatase
VATGRSIAVVVLDTLRKDVFDRSFDWLPGLRFERARSTANWTVPAHASLFTGRYPGELGVHAKQTSLDCPETTLAETLTDAGYTTRAYSANVNITPTFGFDRGFESFELAPGMGGLQADIFDWQSFIAEHRTDGSKRYLHALRECVTSDCATVPSLRRGAEIKLRDFGLVGDQPDSGAQAALDFVDGTTFGDEELLFVNLMEAHAPYAPPESYRTSDIDVESTTYNALLATIEGGPPGVDSDSLREAYDDAVRYLSDRYEELFGRLRESFDLVITLGDHGECFGEHGIYQHAYGLPSELTHVPLVVSGEGFEGARDDPVSLLDVHATVLDALDVDAESRGRSLLADPDERRELFAEYHGVSRQNARKVEAEGRDPVPYDERLLGVAVPPATYGYETGRGFTVEGDADPDDLRARIGAHDESTAWRAVEDADGDVPESVRRQLEDLGYA